MVYAYVALSCAHAALGNPGLQRLAGLVKSAAVFLLTAMLLAFVGYLTASGAIAGQCGRVRGKGREAGHLQSRSRWWGVFWPTPPSRCWQARGCCGER